MTTCKTTKSTPFTSKDAQIERKRKHLSREEDDQIERREALSSSPDEIKAARAAMLREMMELGYKF